MTRGNGRDTSPDLGKALEPCALGADCPFEPSMRQLELERHNRQEVDAEICVRDDKLSDELLGAIKLVREFQITFAALEKDFRSHLRSHRWIEVVVMGLAAGAGGFLTRYFGGP